MSPQEIIIKENYMKLKTRGLLIVGEITNLFPTFTTANPMRSSINGTGEVEDYYQEGRKYK